MEYNDEQKKDIEAKIQEAINKAREGLLAQEQVNDIISKRVKEINEKHIKELEEKEKLAKMSEAERVKHEMETLKEQLLEKEKLIKEKEYKDSLINLMNEKGIDNKFIAMFSNVKDLEQASLLMDEFNNSFKEKLNKEIDNKLLPNIPKATTGNLDDAEIDRIMGIKKKK